MSDLAIRVEGLGKQYRIGASRRRTNNLREKIQQAMLAPLRALRGHGNGDAEQSFWALRDVSFRVNRGEVVGIIGRNGAGKSTLLKILSRITEPTEGEVEIVGRVGSLLEVGTGFHPELTGRENVFLNGAILGMKQSEIARRFDEIVAFAEVEKFLDTPVKHYSSGMYMRLAFAVAAHLEPEILIVDEVLAVGDSAFQAKCFGKMRDVSSSGRTVLLVSHQLETVAKLCATAILLDRGLLIAAGSCDQVLAAYAMRNTASARRQPDSWDSSSEIDIRVSFPQGSTFAPDQGKMFRLTARTFKDPDQPWFVSGLIRNDKQEVLAQFDSRLLNQWFSRMPEARISVTLNHPWLRPGRYTLDVYVCVEGRVVCDRADCAEFTVSPALPYPAAADRGAVARAPVLSDFSIVADASG